LADNFEHARRLSAVIVARVFVGGVVVPLDAKILNIGRIWNFGCRK